MVYYDQERQVQTLKEEEKAPLTTQGCRMEFARGLLKNLLIRFVEKSECLNQH